MPAELRAEWAPIVGNFIIEFGELESAISEVVRLSSTPSQFEILYTLNFVKRLDLAEAALVEWNNHSKELIKEAFKKIRDVVAKRNIIAHNGFSINIYELEGGETRYEFGMTPSYKQSSIWLTKEHLERDTALLVEFIKSIIEWIPKDCVANKVR
ncbi:hypothetical protein [Limnohabitans radicicola]|uniref:Uncharacterized protein n=1 Tax=Limnohabitans radicicola TaxID=2771427 RepID=A0A927FDJ0_9BURK|nr:hypothetical protein [Limnohabitans radicicola]MBD8049395.1 hypothetical protein [Limnohabitans radicicola]